MNTATAASAPLRLVCGRNTMMPTASSAMPLMYVQKRWLGGNHGGTILSKNPGLAKCITPAKVMNPPSTYANTFRLRFGEVSITLAAYCAAGYATAAANCVNRSPGNGCLSRHVIDIGRSPSCRTYVAGPRHQNARSLLRRRAKRMTSLPRSACCW